jgi:NDP-sugar pyrophosphorylase family protein
MTVMQVSEGRPMNPKTRAVVLAGQHAWRDTRFDRLSPRPLLPVANQPLFAYALHWLVEAGLRDVTISVNAQTRALRDAVWEFAPDGANLSLHEDAAPRGPAGGVRDAIAATDAETVVVVDGTSVPAADLRALLAQHAASSAAATILVHPEPGRTAAEGRFFPGGVYAFERRVLDGVPARGFHDIKEGLIPRLYRAGERTSAFVAAEASPRPLDPTSYLSLNDWVIERLVECSLPRGYVASDGVVAHESARISPDAVFVGPVVVGARAQVMARATVVGPASIGAGSIVSAGALVSRSALWNGCLVGEDAVVDRCIAAEGSQLAPRARALSQIVEASRGGRAPAPAKSAHVPFFSLRPRANAVLIE